MVMQNAQDCLQEAMVTYKHLLKNKLYYLWEGELEKTEKIASVDYMT